MECFKVLCTAQILLKYFEIFEKPVFYLLKYCVKILNIFNKYFGNCDQKTKPILLKTRLLFNFLFFVF